MFEQFTDRARKVMALANQEAHRLASEYICPEHILLGLIVEGASVGATVLKNLDVDLRKVRFKVDELSLRGTSQGVMGKLPETPLAKRVVENAIVVSRSLNHKYVGTEHLLLGLVRTPDTVASKVLEDLGLTAQEIETEVLAVIGRGERAKGAEPLPYPFITAINEGVYEPRLRDEFAKIALDAIIHHVGSAKLSVSEAAVRAWEIADAMMAERTKVQNLSAPSPGA